MSGVPNYIYAYYQAIKSGEIIAGKWILALYEYIIRGLEEKAFFLDLRKANRAVRFIETFCHHSKGRLAPQLVTLELWQRAMISCIFGIVDGNGLRQFREVFCLVGRKCGKSLLASGIAEYMVYADGEFGADVFFLAPRLEQTDIVYNDFLQSISAEPDLMAITKKRKTDLYIEETNSSIRKIAFSQKKSDGFNPHLTVCDEIAAWPGDAGIKQYEVMTSALGSRAQPLVLSITTANYLSDGIYDDLFKRSTRVLMGDSRERQLLPFLYTIDDDHRWSDLTELAKSLPNLGVSVGVDFMLEEIAKAEGSLPKRAEFLCKYCNRKQNSAMAWLPAGAVEQCGGEPLYLDDFRDTYAIAGVDLSRTTDLTAVVLAIQKAGIWYLFAKFFLPGEKIEEATARDGIPYQAYVQRGILVPSGDNLVDYHDVYDFLTMLIEQYHIYPLRVMYDRYSAQYLIKDLEAYGFQCDDVFQGYNLTPAIRQLEGLLRDGKIRYGDNDLLKIHLLNAALRHEPQTDRVKLVKIAETAHVDGTAALLDCMIGVDKWHGEIGEQLQNLN